MTVTSLRAQGNVEDSRWETAVRCIKKYEGWHGPEHYPYVAYGHRIRKGEKAVQCIFFKPVEVKNKDAKDGDEETRKYLCMKPFSLFNLDQVEGLENLPSEPVQREYDEKEAKA